MLSMLINKYSGRAKKMKTKILAIILVTLFAFSALLFITIPKVSADTSVFGNAAQSGSTYYGLDVIYGSTYTNTLTGHADSMSVYISYAPGTAYIGVKTTSNRNSDGIINTMRGQAITPTTAIVATSITAHISCTSTAHNVQAAIYDSSGNLVASSNAQSVGTTSGADQTFTLTSNPTLSASKTYIAVVWAQTANGNCNLIYTSSSSSGRNSAQTYGNWPTSVTFSSVSRTYAICVNYQKTANIQCAIYTPNSSGISTVQVGITAQKTLSYTPQGWVTLNFINKPLLTAGTDYILCLWSSDSGVNFFYTGTAKDAWAGSQGGTFSSPTSAVLYHALDYGYNICCTVKSSYTITASADSNGNINPSGSVDVPYNNNQQFTITPNIGYHIADVLIDGSSAGPISTYTFPTVTADHTIAASFAINTYQITVTQTPYGTISPGTTTVNYGDSQTFSVTPDAGYHIVDVSVDGNSVGAVSSYKFTSVDAQHTITASFAITQFSSHLTLYCAPDTVDKPATTVVQGSLSTIDGTPIAGQTVTLTYNNAGTWESIGTATTLPDGSYSYSWTVPSSLANGFYVVQASYAGDGNVYLPTSVQTTGNGDGLFVLPEYALGGLAAFGACLAGFVVVKVRCRRKTV